MRRKETNSVKVVMKMIVEGKGEEEEEDQKNGWLDTIENDMRAIGVCIRDVKN
jgi:hypothetical protein